MSTQTVRMLIRKVRVVGIRMASACIYKKAYYSLMNIFFRFDLWHARSQFECRTYKQMIVDMVNQLKPTCCLGEIISRVKAQMKCRIDIDKEELLATQFIHGKRVHYKKGSFRTVPFDDTHFDCILAVNILCNKKSSIAVEYLISLLSRVRPTYLIVNSVVSPDSSYSHDYGKLLPSVLKEQIKRYDDEARLIHIFRITELV